VRANHIASTSGHFDPSAEFAQPLAQADWKEKGVRHGSSALENSTPKQLVAPLVPRSCHRDRKLYARLERSQAKRWVRAKAARV
jgi:hypothetical protein